MTDKIRELAERYYHRCCEDTNELDGRYWNKIIDELAAAIHNLLSEAARENGWNFDMSQAPIQTGAEILAIIKGAETGKLRRVVLERENDTDHDWAFDGVELSNAWSILAWRPLPPIKEPETGVERKFAGAVNLLDASSIPSMTDELSVSDRKQIK